MLVFWSMIEATIFTFTLKPTASELLGELTGYESTASRSSCALAVSCGSGRGQLRLHSGLNEPSRAKKYGQIVSMVAIEIAVAMFEVCSCIASWSTP